MLLDGLDGFPAIVAFTADSKSESVSELSTAMFAISARKGQTIVQV